MADVSNKPQLQNALAPSLDIDLPPIQQSDEKVIDLNSGSLNTTPGVKLSALDVDVSLADHRSDFLQRPENPSIVYSSSAGLIEGININLRRFIQWLADAIKAFERRLLSALKPKQKARQIITTDDEELTSLEEKRLKIERKKKNAAQLESAKTIKFSSK